MRMPIYRFILVLICSIFVPFSFSLSVKGEMSELQSGDTQQRDLSSLFIESGMQNYTLPDIVVQNIILPEKNYEEGESIEITVIIENNETYAIPGLTLVVMLSKIAQAHGEKPEVSMFNQSLGLIPAISTHSEKVEITGKFGQYALTACIAYESQIIPNTSFSTNIFILSPPIGDFNSLFFCLGSIFAFISVMALVPAIFDRFRYESRRNHSNNTKMTKKEGLNHE